jgi:DNA-binding NtrC family response regulator
LGAPLGEIFRFPLEKPFSEQDQEIVALITHFLSRANDRQKKKMKNILQEVVSLPL